MSDALYNEKILAAARGLDPDDRLEDPQATVQLTSPLCGSRIRVDLRVADGRVAAYGQEVRACALGQSAAAIMKRHAVGRTRAELVAVRDAMEAMLRRDAAAPEGEWAELEVLAPARAHKSRHASILLPFKAVVKAFDEAEAAGASRGDAAGSSARA